MPGLKNRCDKCSKKDLFIEYCKCDKKFCLNCLPYYNHICSFEWKKENKEFLEKNNPKIIYVKVDSI
jgi:hypothetical protein